MKRSPPDVHLNLNVRGMPNSATVAIQERCKALEAEGRDVVRLGLGQSPFPVPEPVVAALREHAAEKDYLPVRGLYRLREAVAAYHARENGVQRAAEDVLIGPGSKELMFLLQLVYYGDLVIPTPAWVSYAPQARILGRQVRLIPTRQEEEWRLSAEGLEKLCAEDEGRPRIVIVNYPSNPTGGTYRLEELRRLARVAQKHRVVLLSDEIYGPLHHKGQHVSLARFYPEGTIISGGLSKWCGAGGWRLGTFCFPPGLRWLLDAMASAASETFTSTSAPIQYAAVRAYQPCEEIETYLRRARRILRSIAHWIVPRLRAVGVRCAMPQGSFYLFPDFEAHRGALAERGIATAAQLCERLLAETGVAILPGEDFGRPPEELTVRIAFVDFDGACALSSVAGMRRTGGALEERLVRQCAPRVFEAIERIQRWVESLEGMPGAEPALAPRSARGHARARFGGSVIAESDDALLFEGARYFPVDAVRGESLTASGTRTTCTTKGVASYFDVVANGERCADGAWTYAEPKPAAREIRGRIAFWKDVEIDA